MLSIDREKLQRDKEKEKGKRGWYRFHMNSVLFIHSFRPFL